MAAITNKAWKTGERASGVEADRLPGLAARSAERLLATLRGVDHASRGMRGGRWSVGQLGERRETSLGRHLGARI